MMATTRKPFELKGVHVLIALLLFFGVTIGMNIAFATLAIKSFPGEDAQSPYQQGLHYNQTLKARRAQAALGWRAETTLTPINDGAAINVRFTGAQGKPLEGLTLEGALRRPTAGKYDVPVRFVSKSYGLYQASIPKLEKGLWDLRAKATDGQNTFDIDERLQWQPSKQH